MSGCYQASLKDAWGRTETAFYYARYGVYALVLIPLECLQGHRGKVISTAVIPDLVFFCAVLFIFHAHSVHCVATLLILLYECLETFAWFYVDSGITFRFLSALDLSFSLWTSPIAVAGLCIGLLLLTGFVFCPLFGPIVKVNRGHIIGACLVAIITVPFVVEEKVDTLYPFRYVDGKPTAAYNRINTAFNVSWNATLRPGYKKKNLILLEIESLETGAIGKFNRRYPKSMPYLSSLTEHAMYFTNMKQQPYTTWSAAGMFVVQCGFPLITNDVWWGVRQHTGFDGYERIGCIPDMLRRVGYKLYSFCSKSCDVMSMKSFMKDRGYIVRDVQEHQLTGGDGPLFEMLRTKTLPQLKDNGEPFVIFVVTDDTHFTDHLISATCDDYLARENYPQMLRSFTCVDQMIQKFVERIKELGMDKDTEVVVFGDHFTMSKAKCLGPLSQRSLSVFFPLHEQDEGWKIGSSKEATYYDLAPTIMDLLGVDRSPPFVFGSSLLRPGKGLVPVTNDLKQIYRLVTGSDAVGKVRCRGTSGFCQGMEF